MAQKKKTIIVLEDDLDGGEAVETIRFGVDGDQYEIDLNEKNAQQFRDSLVRYRDSGRKLNGRPKSKRPAAKTRPAKKATTKASARKGPQASEIRSWAVEKGMKVPERGRIPAEVREAFNAENK